jgi:putative transposase
MPRLPRIEYEKALYHITSRGNNKQKIFSDEKDYPTFIKFLEKALKKYSWQCYAYCLIPNHYHLLIETEDANLSVGMKWLNGIYAKYFNGKNDRVGHLFQGRYHSVLVEKESYLLQLHRYIALNPVRAKIVENLNDWKWNSYLELINKSPVKLISKNAILEHFDASLKGYKLFIHDGIDKPSPFKKIKAGCLLGSKEFIFKVRNKSNITIIPGEVALDKIFTDKSNANNRSRLIGKAYRKYGYSQVEISKHLKLHRTTVNRIINKKSGSF